MKRCVDGEVNGALPHCPEPGCKGRLRLDGDDVCCGGAFDDEVGSFLRCYFRVNKSTIERNPWRTEPKTEGEWSLSEAIQ